MSLTPDELDAARAIGAQARIDHPPSPATLAKVAAICSDAATAAPRPPGAAVGSPGTRAVPVRSGEPTPPTARGTRATPDHHAEEAA